MAVGVTAETPVTWKLMTLEIMAMRLRRGAEQPLPLNFSTHT